MLTFRFSSKDGKMTVCERLTSGMIGKKVRFEFSPEWDNLRKMAIFMAMDGSTHTYRTVDNVEDIATIPASVLALPEHTLYIGICGISETGAEVIPTIRVKGPRIHPGAFSEENPDIDPDNPVWVDVLGDMGNLEELNTEAKDTLVDAINELEEKNRDDVNSEDVMNMILGYMDAHPIIGQRGLSFLRLKAAYAGTVERYNFSEFVLPDGYTPMEYDLVMMNDGWLGYVYKVYPEAQQVDVASLEESLKGPQGIQGAKGDKGDKGEKGDGAQPFPVTLSRGFNGTYTADKARKEAVAAYEAGQEVYCTLPVGIGIPIRVPLSLCFSGIMYFETVYQGTNYRVTYTYNDAVYPIVDNVITVTEEPLAKASDVPKALPSPNALTFTGAAAGSYDGSKPVTIHIPEGGSGDGKDGEDGFSPLVSVSPISGGHRVSILDASGTKTFDVLDGADGMPGKDGAVGPRGPQGPSGAASERGLSFYRLNASLAGTVERYSFSSFFLPEGYVPMEYDLVLTNDGWLCYVYEVFQETSEADVASLRISLKGADGPQGESYILTDADKEAIADIVKSGNIPDYWLFALQKGAENINTSMANAGRNKSAFLFYADAHWDSGGEKAPMLLKYLYRNTAMRKTIFGGDIVSTEGTDYDTMAYIWEWRKAIKELPDHHSVVGNHDDGNTTNNLFPAKYVYGCLMAAEETNDIVRGSDMYYYIDDVNEKTRYLYLDTGYQDINALSAGQTSFITESLKSTPAGWHIIVAAHIWFMPDYEQYNVRPIPITGLSNTAASVCAILDSYNARSGEFAGCGARVEFCIGGHVHIDHVDTTDGGIPIIVCETASWNIRSAFTNTAGTDTESAVSGIIADYDADKVTVVRVGRGNSFEVSLLTGDNTDIPDDDPTEPVYTNVLDTVGYQTGYRVNSGGTLIERADRCVTGLIKARPGDTVYFKNVVTLTSDYGCNIAHYDSSQTAISGKSYVIAADNAGATWYDNGNLKSYTVGERETEWVRFCFVTIDDTSIITVNEPIE